MGDEYIKWMPFVTGVLSALIAAVVACFIAMLNNHAGRVKSQNEWRRDRAIEVIMEFKKAMKEYDDTLHIKAIELSKEGCSDKVYAKHLLIINSLCDNKIDLLAIAKDKLELFIPSLVRKELMRVYSSYTNGIVDYYASYAIKEAVDISKTDIDMQPLFLKIIDNLK
ncbi:hypothetical protein AB6V67_20185 [Serratia marcescens]|uniref:hypothetical protein n=1 Tax=Serratia marcescens TaxID=615 RepID=UPI0029E14F5E|nr:hypothetical protein [Serratia marcescens]